MLLPSQEPFKDSRFDHWILAASSNDTNARVELLSPRGPISPFSLVSCSYPHRSHWYPHVLPTGCSFGAGLDCWSPAGRLPADRCLRRVPDDDRIPQGGGRRRRTKGPKISVANFWYWPTVMARNTSYKSVSHPIRIAIKILVKGFNCSIGGNRGTHFLAHSHIVNDQIQSKWKCFKGSPTDLREWMFIVIRWHEFELYSI